MWGSTVSRCQLITELRLLIYHAHCCPLLLLLLLLLPLLLLLLPPLLSPAAAAAAAAAVRTLKIIATLGPATWTPDGMKTLLDAGVDVVGAY